MRLTLLSFFLLAVLFSQSQNRPDSVAIRFLEAAYNGDSVYIETSISDTSLLSFKDYKKRNALMYAAATGHLNICYMLIEAGIPLDEQDVFGNTALIIAVKEEKFEISELLAWSGANINVKDEKGFSALHYAAGLNNKLLCDMLIFYGCDINATDNSGNTALHLAAYYGASEVVELLSAKNANTQSINNQGFTPLMLAAQNNKILSFHKLNISNQAWLQRNFQGFTAYDILVENETLLSILDLPLSASLSDGTKLIDSITLSAFERNHFVTAYHLRKNGAKVKWKPQFCSFSLSLNQKISKTDFFTGFDIGINEHRHLINGSIGVMIRPYGKRLLTNYENKRIQVFEYRWNINFGINKYWMLTPIQRSMLFLCTGAKAGISFYDYQAIKKGNNKGIWMLNSGLALKGRNNGISIYYEYGDLYANNTNPHSINVSLVQQFSRFKKYKPSVVIW